MFGSSGIGSTFSLSSLLGGASRLLGVTNQIIPLYQKAQPLFKNAKSALGVLKNVSITDKEVTIKTIDKEQIAKNDNKNLVFFQ